MRFLCIISNKQSLLALLIFICGLEVEGLNCWNCNDRNNAPMLCEHAKSKKTGHPGSSKPCPPENIAKLNTPTENSKWGCWIMESVVRATGRVEVSKGCIRYFNSIVVPDSSYLKINSCYEHDDHVIQREVTSHDIAMCICDTDDCNKYSMVLEVKLEGNKTRRREIGFLDFERKSKKSKAHILYAGFVVTFIIPLILVSRC